MPELSRPDGTTIHYEIAGDTGPPVILASYWSWSPGVFDEMLADLATDHRVVTYHLRGTGESSSDGPYDVESDIADLEAVVEATGGPAVLIATADSSNRAVRLAARRPELIGPVISLGAPPFARSQFKDQEGMLASDTVVNAFVDVMENSYRVGVRNLMEVTNPQMGDAELRERVAHQIEYSPQEPSVSRLRDWIDDDPLPAAQAIGDRLWIFAASDVAGPWMPPFEQVLRLTREKMPDAHLERIEPGPVTGPHETAEAVREVSAPLREGEPSGRK
jgi:pimeloyl-ACP methyl ester carboxylesterase